MKHSKKPSHTSQGIKPAASSTRIAAHLETLKTMMISATDFSKPMMYFMDDIVPDDNFLSEGKISRSEVVAGTFRAISEILYRQMWPQHTETARQLIIHSLEKFKFSHGAFQIGKCMVTLIYFQDIDHGMAALAMMTGSDKTIFSRFSAQQFAPSGDFTFVPGNSQQTH